MLWLSMAWLWFWCVVALSLPLNDLLRSVRYQNAAGRRTMSHSARSQCFAKPFVAPTRVALPSRSRCDCDHKNALPGTYVNDGVHVFFGQPRRQRKGPLGRL